jgi:RNA polymerase sigma factor (TIGR02999 family)
MQPGDDCPAELPASFPGIGAAAPARLFEVLYDQLRGLAGQVRQGRAGATMSTTALVHEAYIKLASAGEVDLQSRLHFFRLAARAMRQVLVDAARRKVADKRGGDVVPVTFDEALHATPMRVSMFLALDAAIDRLGEVDPRAAQVVECRFFAGLSVEETASALDISARTVKRDWRVARALLTTELNAAAQE